MHCNFIIGNKNCEISDGYFSCGDGSRCLKLDKMCDYNKDCADESDEGGNCG